MVLVGKEGYKPRGSVTNNRTRKPDQNTLGQINEELAETDWIHLILYYIILVNVH